MDFVLLLSTLILKVQPQCSAVCVTYPSVQSCAAPLVLGIWQGSLLQQVVDTVSVTSQNS